MADNEQYRQTLAENLKSTQNRLAGMNSADRAAQLGFSSIEDSYVQVYDVLGQAKMLLGRQNDGNFAVTYQNGEPPPKTTPPLVTAHQLSFSIGWDGNLLDGNGEVYPERPTNVERVDVHVSETPGFTPTGATVIGSLTGEGAVSVFADSDSHYIKLVAVTNADVIGPPSEETASIPLPADQIAVGAIGAEQIASDLVLSSRIIVGDPTLARVELQGGSTINSGLVAYNQSNKKTIQISPEGWLRTYAEDGNKILEIGTDGTLSSYNGSGDRSFNLDRDGNLSMVGTLSTGSEGEARMEMQPGRGIVFYPDTVGSDAEIDWTNWQQYTFTDPYDGTHKAGFRVIGPEVKDYYTGTPYFMDLMSGAFATEYFSIRVREGSSNQEHARMMLRSSNIELDSGPMPGQGHYVKDNWASQVFMPWGGNAASGTSAQAMTLMQSLTYYDSILGHDVHFKSGFQNTVDPRFAAVIYSKGGLVLKDWEFDKFTTFTCGDIHGGQIWYNGLHQNSSSEFKEDIDELPDSALSVVRGAPSRRWRYREGYRQDPAEGYHVGPMADDLPDWLTQDSVVVEYKPSNDPENMADGERGEYVKPNSAIDLASQVGVMWEAIRELDNKVNGR